MATPKRSFFERLTGAVKLEEEDTIPTLTGREKIIHGKDLLKSDRETAVSAYENEPADAELTIDMYESPNDVVIRTMVAGVKPEDLDISITRDMVTIRGTRESDRTVSSEDYFHQELYWGSFSRTIVLPKEIEVEEAEASEKHGLLTIRLPKIDKNKQAKLKVRG
ncbi:MAG: Hsp20/alpha crystallin family protein [Minisyncoccia bacterium]